MIEKLSQRIFLLIMISLSVVILGIIMLFAILNYTNTINTATLMMDRFMNGEVRKNGNEKVNPEIDGMYIVRIENSKIIENSDLGRNKIIEEYAIKISEQRKETGTIGKYIYKVRKFKGNEMVITFMENEEAITHAQIIIIVSVIVAITSLIIIYVIAKKVSNFIVKPVEETFEKQKQFISDASHELKTPLAVIEANADVLEDEIGKNKWMDYIQNEVESMNKLINELLLLAKVENIDNLKEHEQIDLSKQIQYVISMFKSMADEKNIIIKSNLQEEIYINGNKEDIEHIMSTLIDNAINHTEKGKDVIVELSRDKSEIIIQVKNFGEPIPEEEREKIFERFYRVDKSRSRKERRYGLGLSIAKSIVQKYKGNIEVKCKEGCTIFRVNIGAEKLS